MQLSDIRTDAREKADELETGFISDTQLDRFIDQGHLYVYGKIVQAFEGHFVVPGTALNGGLFTTTANTLQYALPTGIKKLVRVEGRGTNSTSENDFRKLRSIPIGDRKLPQVDANTYQIRLWFIPERTRMTATTDEPSVPEAYHHMISEYAAMQCLRKSGEGIFKESMEMFNIELQSLLETVEYRSQEPERMVITDNHPSDYEDWLYNTQGNAQTYLMAGSKIYIGYDPKFYLRGF